MRKSVLIFLIVGVMGVSSGVFYLNSTESPERDQNTEQPGEVDVSTNASNTENFSGEDEVKLVIDTENGCDDQCLKDTIVKIAQQDGPAKAIEFLTEQMKTNEDLGVQCHEILHSVGYAVAVGGKNDYVSPNCLGAYVHGYLQGRAGQAEDLRAFVSEATAFCDKLKWDKSELEWENQHFGCIHGSGHAIAGVIGDNLEQALKGCGYTGDDGLAATCTWGVMMEYMKGELVAEGWHTKNDKAVGEFTAKGAYDKDLDIVKVCKNAPVWALPGCYGTMPLFLGPSIKQDLGQYNQYCEAAPGDYLVQNCFTGVGSWVVELGMGGGGAYQNIWPPKDEAEATTIAKWLAEKCSLVQGTGDCVYGAVTASMHHLHEAGFPRERIPNVCLYIKEAEQERCRAGYEMFGVWGKESDKGATS